MRIRPRGYPLNTILDEYPRIEDPEVFQYYAREQWNGLVANEGDFLFDRRMYPDFAYEIEEVYPPSSVIGASTCITVTEEDQPEKREDTGQIGFEDIVGQDMARRKCRIIEQSLQEPELFGKWAPRNVLFHGPPGTGKTMLAKALANKANVPLFPIKATQLIGEYVGDAARQIHQLYEDAEDTKPCIIFIDELDAVALDRRFQEIRGDVSEVVNALLTEMDGINEHMGICTIGVTNRIETLDSAIRSRFEEEIEFTLPDTEERYDIISLNLKDFPLPVKDTNIKELADITAGLSGRDLVEKVMKTTLHEAIIENREHVTGNDLIKVAQRIMKKDSGKCPAELYT